jgi:hypothetical protein
MTQSSNKNYFACRPDLGCARIAALVAKKAATIGAGPLSAYALPDLSGGLFFEFRSRSGLIQIKWQQGGGTNLSKLPGTFSIGDITDHNLQSPVFSALAFVLTGLLAREEFAVFSPVAQISVQNDVPSLENQLQNNWLIGDRTGWFDYKLEKPRSTPDGLAIAFVARDQRVSFLLQTNYKAQSAADKPDNRAILALNGVRVLLTSDTRSDADREHFSHQVELVLAFAITRLSTPRQDDARSTPADEPQSQHSLIEAQLRRGGHILPLVFALDPDTAWRQFMADDNFDYFLSVTLQTTGRNSYVWHSDRTCFFMRPFVNGILSTLINYPWQLSAVKGFDFFTTNLSDKDIISDGSEHYLAQLLEHCAENGADEQTIILENTCIPKLLGQDMTHIAKSFSERHTIPILQSFPDQGWGRHETGIRQRFSVLMDHAEDTSKSDLPSINLVGFNLAPDLDELVAILTNLGVEINANLLPNINLAHARQFKRGWLQVLNQIPGFEEAYKGLFEPTGVPAISPASPYGFTASMEWFSNIAEQLGKAGEWLDYRQNSLFWLKDELAHFRALAQAHTLGFIADTTQLGRIWDAPRNLGVPLLTMLNEFGFKSVAYVFEDSGDGRSRKFITDIIAELLVEKGQTPDMLSILFFSNRSELHHLIANGPAELLFSEYFDDPRLAEVGRATFSLGDFEKGFAGAQRTFWRLYNRLQTPYFRKLYELAHEDVK